MTTIRQRLRKRRNLLRKLKAEHKFEQRNKRERVLYDVSNRQDRQARRYFCHLMKIAPEAFDIVLGTTLCGGRVVREEDVYMLKA
jgi:hypothetical protein